MISARLTSLCSALIQTRRSLHHTKTTPDACHRIRFRLPDPVQPCNHCVHRQRRPLALCNAFSPAQCRQRSQQLRRRLTSQKDPWFGHSLRVGLFALSHAPPLNLRARTAAPVRSTPALARDGTIYVGSQDSSMFVDCCSSLRIVVKLRRLESSRHAYMILNSPARILIHLSGTPSPRTERK